MSAVESAQQAARLTDPVGHGLGMLGMIGGAILGAVVAGLLIAGGIVTGGVLIAVVVAGCVAGGGLAGGALLRGIQRAAKLNNPTTGNIGNGSGNVRIGSRPAARAKIDFAGGCNGLPLNHFPQSMVPIAEGSATVRINGMLAARVTSRLVCGAPIIEGKENVYIGGPTAQVLPIYDTEEWLETGLMVLGGAALLGGAVLAALAGGAALLGFAAWTAGGMLAFEGLGWVGDQIGPGWRDILQGAGGLLTLGAAGVKGWRGRGGRPGQAERTPEIKMLPPPPKPVTPTAAERVANLPGHGNARHGSHTTIAQQTTRVQTGIAPDGKMAPTSRATKFDTPEAELDAVSRAQQRTANRVATGQKSTAIQVDSNGRAKLPRDESVVTGHPGGYGSGVEVVRNPTTGQPLPGRPVQPTGQDPNALVVLEYKPATNTWEPVTQYPTNKPVTP